MMRTSTLSVLAFASCTVAQTVSNCVGAGVCYAINVPASTAASGTGDIYIQITGPTTMSWIGLGQGTGMSGANIFVVYANDAGNNVTVSPRLGTGRRQPSTNGASSQVTLLAGSGIENSMMTANFRCSNCNTWSGGSMDFRSTQSNWIWAYLRGSTIASNSVSASISQHNEHGEMSLNLQTAAGGSSSNPFIESSSDTSNSNTGSNQTTTSGGNSGSSNPTVSSSSSNSNKKSILIAHGVLLSLAFVIFYPLGAISIRLLNFSGLVWVHAGWMIFTYLIVLAGMGLGIWYAKQEDYLSSDHAIIGLVTVGCLILQPFSGFLHHNVFKRKGGPSAFTLLHVWWGRIIVTLGIINGGLGLRLAGNTRTGEIVYGVVAGVVWVAWMAVVALKSLKRGDSDSGNDSSGSNEKIARGSTQHRDGSTRESYSGREGSPQAHGATRVV